MTTWLEAYLSGDATIDNIDDWVQEWHDSTTITGFLYTHLGLTEDEYKQWVESPESLEKLISQFQLAKCRGCQEVVIYTPGATECPACGFDAFGAEWGAKPDDADWENPLPPEFNVSVTPAEAAPEPSPPPVAEAGDLVAVLLNPLVQTPPEVELSDKGKAKVADTMAQELQKAAEALSPVLGDVHPSFLPEACQRAADAVLEAQDKAEQERRNYAGACADLDEIRRAVGAGDTGSNVGAVTDAFNKKDQAIQVLGDDLAARGKRIDALKGQLKVAAEVIEKLQEAHNAYYEVLQERDELKALLDTYSAPGPTSEPDLDGEGPLTPEEEEAYRRTARPGGKRLRLLATLDLVRDHHQALATEFTDIEAAHTFQELRAQRFHNVIKDFLLAAGYFERDGAPCWSVQYNFPVDALKALNEALNYPTGSLEDHVVADDDTKEELTRWLEVSLDHGDGCYWRCENLLAMLKGQEPPYDERGSRRPQNGAA